MSLSASNLFFAYHAWRPVLRGLSVDFPPGSRTAVVGPNGAGKSTLLRLLAGLLRPGEGSVQLDGRPVGAMNHRERSRLIAYIPQRPSLAFAFTVRQVVDLGRFGAPRRAGAADRALALVGLADRAGDPFHELSAGQQQRAALARALAQLDLDDPGLATGARALLADEPVSAMDPRHALEAMNLISAAAARGLAVVAVLHDLALAARWADRAAVVDASGHLAACGPAEQALIPGVLGPVFGVDFVRAAGPAGPVLVPVGPGPA